MNDSFRAVNLLLKAGEEVRRLQEPFAVQGATHPRARSSSPVSRQRCRCWKRSPPRWARRSSAARPLRARKPSRSSPCAIGLWDTSTAARCRRAGRAGCWSGSSFPSRSSTTADLDSARPAREIGRAPLRRRRTGRRQRRRGGGGAAGPRCRPEPAQIPRKRRHDPDHRRLNWPGQTTRPAVGQSPGWATRRKILRAFFGALRLH